MKENQAIRQAKYVEAIAEALVQAMECDERVFVMGIGVDDPTGVFGSTRPAFKRFGKKRVFTIPLSENAITGVGIGAALSGLRPIMVHARNDFLLLTMDQLVNHAAKWSYMAGGRMKVPFTIRAIIGRGWGQGPQHSQSLQALFVHTPGLKVVMPATPYDAKGLLLASIRDDCPVIFIEHRRLYDTVGPVPEETYTVPLGKGAVRREGRDVTVVASSLMVLEALQASQLLQSDGISAEVIDLRTLSPLDDELVFDSVRKTGRLVVADTGWETCGVAAEVSARVASNVFGSLKAPIRRVCLPDSPTPTCPSLEKEFYPGAEDIAAAVRTVVGRGKEPVRPRASARTQESWDKGFTGPF